MFISHLRSSLLICPLTSLSAQEMTQLLSLASEFDKTFRLLEDYFNSLTTEQKSYVCKKGSELPPPPAAAESATVLPSIPINETSDEPAVTQFHNMADNVLQILCQLQPLIKFKQSHLPSIGISPAPL